MEKKARSKSIYRFLAVLLTFFMVLSTIPAAAKVKKSVTVGSKEALFKEMVKDKSKTIYYETEKGVTFNIKDDYLKQLWASGMFFRRLFIILYTICGKCGNI